MHENQTDTELDVELDIFGQQPGLNIYTQICLCYPMPAASSHGAILDRLTQGLERLAESFPWVAGRIVNEGAEEGSTGTFKIRALEKTPRLVVKDLTEDPSMPTFEVLREAEFPFRMIDESVVAPRRTLPTPEEVASGETPVFVVQATFVGGGLLLTFVGHHGAMDMTGLGQVKRLLAKACRGEAFSREEVAVGNVDRDGIIPLLDDEWTPGPEVDRVIVKPSPTQAPATTPPKCSWVYFIFSPASLASLKALANESLPSPGFVSTDDALSAFIWQAVTRARLPRLNRGSNTTFARAVDPRRYLGIPPTYPGLVQNMAYHTRTIEELVEAPLGRVAWDLRCGVDPRTCDVGYRTRALATYLHRSADKSGVSVTAGLDVSCDMMLSSWAKEGCYELDFGLGLGRPEAVRRPGFVPVESLMYLMPRRGDGEIAAGLCLRDEDAARMKADSEFVKSAEYVG